SAVVTYGMAPVQEAVAMRRSPPATAAATALLLAACTPSGAPPGVDRDQLDAAISKAIGDPNSCVLIADSRSGRVLYQYNTATACANAWPACDHAGDTKVKALLEATARDGKPRQLSCDTQPD